MRAVLIGNYGVGNLGDEALKAYFLERFADVQWTVLTAAQPRAQGEVPRLPFGLRSMLGTPWWQTIRAIRASDAVVFGGGSLFTDIESMEACRLWGWHASVARFFRKPLLFAFQGIGPFASALAQRKTAEALTGAAFISVRDEASFERARSLLPSSKIVRSFDPVISLLKDAKAIASTQKVFTVIPRGNSTDSFVVRAANLALQLRLPVEILSMQPGDPNEQSVCNALAAQLLGSTILPVANLQELASHVAASAHVLSARYHGALAALALSVPFEVVSQAQGDKLSSLHPSADRAYLLSFVEIGERALREAFQALAHT